MPILNYTTSVESDKSIAEITGLLTRFGARSITTEFDNDGFVSGISFIIMIETTASGECCRGKILGGGRRAMIDIIGIGNLSHKTAPMRAVQTKREHVRLDGGAKLNITCNVSMEEIEHWSPQKITDFFMGVAKVAHAADDRNWPNQP